MDYDVVIFWLVCLSCLSGLVVALMRFRSAGYGWIMIYLGILLVATGGWLWERSALIYAAATLWFVFVLFPGIIGKLYHRRFLQQRYSSAYRLAWIIRCLHPGDGWREQLGIIRALALAHQGDLNAAAAALRHFENVKSPIGLSAIINLYRMTHQWEELLAWYGRHRSQLAGYPQLLPVLLRAHGESGDVPGLIRLYGEHRHQIARLTPTASRDLCRLALFAFCGQRALVERLLAGSLAVLPPLAREFWLATADLAAGRLDSARQQFEVLLSRADPPTRLAVERRLSRFSRPPESLDESALKVIEDAALDHDHDERFGMQRPLFSKRARATQMLILFNLVMFVAEMFLGGGTNEQTLYRLGAMNRPAVLAGEWWRLLAALFLHFGPVHLALNMFALWLLGPFVEFALGLRRFLLVYLFAGMGSMGVVLALTSGPAADQQLTVGASGCVMALVGATGALMLRGWLREKALTAKRRLFAMLLIVVMQSAFDALVPQVSMAAHLSGAVLGFLLTLMLRDRLRA